MKPTDFTILSFNPGQGRQLDGTGSVDGVPAGKVYARVRMWVDNKEVDENFDVPEVLNGLPDDERTRTAFVLPEIQKRLKELETGNLDNSKVHLKSHNIEQNVHDRPEVANV